MNRLGFPMAIVSGLMLLLSGLALAQPSPPVLRIRVVDQQNAVIEKATAVLVDADGNEITAKPGEPGYYVFDSVKPGVYTLQVTELGFGTYQNLVEIKQGVTETQELEVTLAVATTKQEVTVSSDTPALSLSQDENANSLVLKGEDLEALPDDPDDLADALQALAGPSAGPNGGQFYIDGFSGGQIPNKASIREVRINQNPFSAEYDHIGFGRIEILTKPGSDQFHGQAMFGFNDESLNSRYPFAPNRAPYQNRRYGLDFGGPLIKNKSSFSLDVERRSTDDNSVVSATILDSNLNLTPFSLAMVTPQDRTHVSSRIDYQLTPKNTLVGHVSYFNSNRTDEGIGQFSLPSRGFDAKSRGYEGTLTETAMITPTVINETRFRFDADDDYRNGLNNDPGIEVLQAFTGGGAQVGHSFDLSREYELQNLTSWIKGKHSVKAGFRLEGQRLTDTSESNYGGTFTFAGGLAPVLDANNQVVLNPDGTPELTQITSLERYRRTLLFQSLGMTGTEIRALGGGATQFSITGGNPTAAVTQYVFGGFVQDDWRMLSNFMLSGGLRYETQTNVQDKVDVAPRLAFAWSPVARRGQRPKTVVRGGIGIFYDRFGSNLVLQAERLDGLHQQEYLIMNPDFFPTIPSLDQLQAGAQPLTIRRIGDGLKTSYMIQSALSVERQLPGNFTVSASFVHSRGVHMLRSANINAPLPDGSRPLGTNDNVFEYRSDGLLDQNQMIINVSNRFSRNLTLFGNYMLGKAMSNTDGASFLPANPYDLADEWGRSGFDVRHRAVMGGSVMMPWNVRLNPFLIVSSGRPFNITTGRDLNGDTVFNDRPALATDLTKPGVIVTPFGAFDPNPGPGEVIIPRNFAQGPGFFLLNMRLTKTVGFGGKEGSSDNGPGGPRRVAWAGRGPGGGHGHDGHGGFFGGGSEYKYNLSFSVSVQNLLNHVNLGTPIGNLTSPLFGESNTTAGGFGRGGGNMAAGNRRIELQMRFSF
jgi:hypothetical protein